MTAQDPDFYTRDLFNAIDKGDFPSWDVKAQIITPDQAEKYPINIFDVTKTLPEIDFPLRSFGKITLNRNPDDFFTEVEQAAFSPTSIVPGWEPSPDPGKWHFRKDAKPLHWQTVHIVLQTRLFAYGNTQRYRLGVNFLQLPINAPIYSFTPLQRDGANDTSKGYGKIPPYLPTSLESKPTLAAQYIQPDHEKWIGTAVNFASELDDKADFEQPRDFWNNVLGGQPGQQAAFVYNVSVHLCNAIKDVRMAAYGKWILDRALGIGGWCGATDMFAKVDPNLAMQIMIATEARAKMDGTAEGGDPSLDRTD
jgi:catalase